MEGFVFTTGLNMLSTEPVFLDFKKAYVKRFDAEPDFPAVLAYEATMYLIEALAASDNLETLPE